MTAGAAGARMVLDRDRCTGAGQCVRTDPGLFEQSEEDGLVLVLGTATDQERLASWRAATEVCPSRALRLEEG
ncbi:ferredoxin [Kitasatospora sp. NPDC051853]|uniref:ferredoxin n=1 Tax=Kitasatospora sp. NPDC051853 TaxID=3364058 RepID=UPI0037BD38BE